MWSPSAMRRCPTTAASSTLWWKSGRMGAALARYNDILCSCAATLRVLKHRADRNGILNALVQCWQDGCGRQRYDVPICPISACAFRSHAARHAVLLMRFVV